MRKTLFAMCALMANTAFGQTPEWSAANLNKTCDRACLVNVMDGYMNAIFMHNPKAVPPLAKDYRMTENTGVIEVGEGVLWRNRTQPTTMKTYIPDPASGQVLFNRVSR